MNKLGTMIGLKKRRILVFALAGALAAALGSGSALAANASGISLPEVFTVFSMEGSENASIAVKEEDGARSFSTDGGKTWSETAPDGLVEKEVERDSLPDGDGFSVSVKADDDGVISYSTDGGRTWSGEAPEGATVSVEKDGFGITYGTIGE